MRKRIWKTKNCLLILVLTICYMVSGANADVNDLIAALNALEDHITGVAPLSGSEIAAHKATIDLNSQYIGDNATVITASFDLVTAYDTEIGPLFVAGSPVQSFSRSSTSDEDIAWAVYNVMQYIMDYTYTVANVVSHEALLNGFKFGSSAHFPGAVDPPVDPQVTYTATIDGTYLDMWGHEIMHEDRPAVKCTGTYLAPGSIVTITVPSSIVGNGYTVRVCAHSWDFSNKPTIKRLDRSSLVYSIDSTQVKVASPLGGGIYIQVPEGQDAGIIDVQIKNAVRSPYFSAKSFHTTTLSEWQNIERNHPGPWADFQSEKFIMQVPTDWIYNFDDPVTLMQDWDTAMDIVDALMGFPSRTRESMYQQVDLFFRASVFAPGYPTVNVTYNPNTSYGGDHNHWMLNGPQYVPDTVFHEEGHGYLFVKFPGERESAVNLLHVPVFDHYYNDLDYAFRTSRGSGNTYQTLDTTAITWMTVFNFSFYEAPMASGEKAYQLKGHAKFVDIARLFGWDKLGDFWYSINADYEDGIIWSKDGSDIDDLIFRWCECAGVDLRPLFHFWGTHPVNAPVLENRIETAGLPRSPEILNTLGHYKSIVPADNAAFQDHALDWWQRVPSIGGNWTEREHTRQWDTTEYWQDNGWDYCGTDPAQADGEIYTEATHDRIVAVVDGLIELYFPGSDIEPPTPNPMTWATAPYATGDSSITMVATTASDPCGVEYYFRCTAGGGNDSGWQPGTTYTDTGLAPETQYTYTVQARDLSPAQNITAPSTAESATTGPDSTPPTPDPMTWASVPAAGSGSGSLAGQLGILNLTANGGINPATSAPWAEGDTYRFAFFTSATTDAVSADISTYNAWVQGLADATTVYNIGSVFGATWKVIGSTDAVDARDNTSTNPGVNGTGEAIFLLDGSTVVASDYADLWDGSIQHIIDLTEQGTISTHWPFTGTYLDGTEAPGHGSSFGALGDGGEIHQGRSDVTTEWIWRVWTGAPATSQLQMYALSDPLVIVAPADPNTSIGMTATVASDVSGVEYYFDEISGNPGGDDSGWQPNPNYTDTGLTPGTTYTYTVTARDLSLAQNATAPSTAESATTAGGAPDTDPPTPNPATFASPPAAVSDTEITMTATTGSDATGPVEYFFNEISGNPGGTDSGWTTNPVYNDTGLTG
nr:hypothetical protein [Phycisphaerae bacterium]NIR65910.1 hypothetical protein [candidate division Zixibacteria bacterium]NIP55443.1 hypothetical protein [Phycisphaerae bacterium]NIS54151.1 hypothetical protein [Phycisphaerae bacterium]NIU10520.1 hypothetical protein [Phycisphaerae bacterium]